MHGRNGFTLVELLIVIFILGVLISLLLPVVWHFRQAAMSTVCGSRIRDLTLASLAYLQDHQSLPQPPRHGGLPPSSLLNKPAKKLPSAVQIVQNQPPVRPHQIERRLLNDLRPYLKYPRIDASTAPAALPVHVQSPLLEGTRQGRGPHFTGLTDNPYYTTGYSYVARLDEATLKLDLLEALQPLSDTLPVLLRPDRVAAARPRKRAPIWCDTIAFELLPTPRWHYTHNGRAQGRAVPLTKAFAMPDDCIGQHVGYSDGSVEWVPADDLRLEPGSLLPKDTTASYTLTHSWYWWF